MAAFSSRHAFGADKVSFLYLFRHGEADSQGLMTGRRDIPLTPNGERQACLWGERLRALPFSAAWCSPLQRAVQTAALILAPNSGPLRHAEPRPDLAEISLGEWEGKSKAEAARQYPEIWRRRGMDMANTAPPGGESFAKLSARALPEFKKICRSAAKHSYSLVAAHQAVNRVILAQALGLPLRDIGEIPQPHCALTIFELSRDGEARIAAKEWTAPEGAA